MKERWRLWLPLIWITLALLLFGILEALAQPLPPWKKRSFQERIHYVVDQALMGRDGIVLGWDRVTGETWLLGNRALLQQGFSPGSVMKIITAEAALRSQIPQQKDCEGHETLFGKQRFCWNSQGHGRLDLAQALSQSCNLFFGRLGLKIGSEKLLEILHAYHWDPQWKSLSKTNRQSLDPVELALGESPALRVTPQQMANFWESFLRKLDHDPNSAIKRGLSLAATQGTARTLGRLKHPALAKTGTIDSSRIKEQTDAWLVTAQPTSQPRFAWVIFLKNAHGYLEPTQLGFELLKITEDVFDVTFSSQTALAPKASALPF